MPTISGSPFPGDTLIVQIVPPGQSPMMFKPTVLVAKPERELRWLGTFMGRWMFAGEHYFLLDQLSPGTTRLTQGERFFRATGTAHHARADVNGDQARLCRDE